MLGLKIKCEYEQKKIELHQLIDVIADEIKNLYWVINNRVFFNHKADDGVEFVEYQESYEEIILAEKNDYRLTSLDFIIKYSKFVIGDWSEIYGIKNKDLFTQTKEIDNNFFKGNALIYFRCIDSAYWEVFTESRCILEILKKEFKIQKTEFCN